MSYRIFSHMSYFLYHLFELTLSINLRIFSLFQSGNPFELIWMLLVLHFMLKNGCWDLFFLGESNFFLIKYEINTSLIGAFYPNPIKIKEEGQPILEKPSSFSQCICTFRLRFSHPPHLFFDLVTWNDPALD